MKNYIKLLRFLKGHERLFALSVMALMVTSLFEGFQLSFIVPLTDRVFNHKPIVLPSQVPKFLENIVVWLNGLEPQRIFWSLPFIVITAMVLKNGFIYLSSYLMNNIAQKVMRDVRFRLFEKIQNLSLDYFSKKRAGELISRITHDVSIVENAVSYGITDLFQQTFKIIVCVSIAFSIHFKAALVIFFIFPLLWFPISQIGRKLRKIATRTQERMADINSILLETISGVKVVKAFCTEQYEISRFKEKNQDYYRLKLKSTKRLLLLSPITEIFGVICGVLMIFWWGRQVMEGQLSSGIFILFFASIMSIISPIKKLGNVNALTQQGLSANLRIYDVLDKEPTVKEKPSAMDLPIIQKGITFADVWFCYDAESGDVLKDINLNIKAGQLIAIVGPTGTGKSTLVNLIPRFYDPRCGAVKIDDIDLREVTFRSLRQQIGIVAQETFLFNDSVKANIAYGTPEATFGQIEMAARKAYSHRFINEMPEGYDTVIGDRGFRLSGGEKQRISIARAILKNPPILILDEATSQLDSESEKYVQEALDGLMKGRTVIAIAHRLSTVIKADRIIVLDQGRIVGDDKHDKLLESCPLYRRLYETQFQM
jgi:ATP-binding cassette, subfamily B, bacterial MsbA